jgi:uncharacterized membrane protein
MSTNPEPSLPQQINASTENVRADTFGFERLVFFSDAVFAIAITLLILEIRLPAIADPLNSQQLFIQLLSIWPRYLAYAISFLVIGLVWTGHHRRFRYIVDYDRRLIFINLLLLMAVAFIPFPTAVLSEYGNRTATIFYALTILIVGLISTFLWVYAAYVGRLVNKELTPEQIRMETLRNMAVPIVFLLSIALAFWNDDLAKIFWALSIPITWFIRKG